MTVDAYEPCPCGSGKKLKFCCIELVDEVAKANRLIESNQPKQALKLVEKLRVEHPKRPWPAICEASILLDEGDDVTAKAILAELLKHEPEHVLGICLYASACLGTDGYRAARPAIYKAYQKGVRAFPHFAASLALETAQEMSYTANYLSARQHLALAMRIVDAEERQAVFMSLLEFDGDASIPYPLRSVHLLSRYEGQGDAQIDARKATALAEMGCFEPAARLFTKLAEQDPQSAVLWQNAGFCRAWDGDEKQASEGLHRAAALYRDTDFDRAVEVEVLAQLIDLQRTEDRVSAAMTGYDVESVSRLLTVLSEDDRLARVEQPPEENESRIGPRPVAIFDMLDRPLPATSRDANFKRSDVPNVIGRILCFDKVEGLDQFPGVILTAFTAESQPEVNSWFERVAGDLVKAQGEPLGLTPNSMPRELTRFEWHWHFPADTSPATQTALELEQWRSVVMEQWPEIPLSALGGKSPRDAAADPELRLPLAAAFFVLDALCQRNRYAADLDALRSSLGVPAPNVLSVDENTSINACSVMEVHRLPVEKLTNEQLAQTAKRVGLLRHSGFLRKVLAESFRRVGTTDLFDGYQTCMMLSDLSLEQNERGEALEWAARAKDFAKAAKSNSFERTLQVELRELALKLQDPDDPSLPGLMRRMADYYGPKLPGFREQLAELAARSGVSVSLEEGVGAVTASGLWTPSEAAAESADSGEKKLWLPGQ